MKKRLHIGLPSVTSNRTKENIHNARVIMKHV